MVFANSVKVTEFNGHLRPSLPSHVAKLVTAAAPIAERPHKRHLSRVSSASFSRWSCLPAFKCKNPPRLGPHPAQLPHFQAMRETEGGIKDDARVCARETVRIWAWPGLSRAEGSRSGALVGPEVRRQTGDHLAGVTRVGIIGLINPDQMWKDTCIHFQTRRLLVHGRALSDCQPLLHLPLWGSVNCCHCVLVMTLVDKVTGWQQPWNLGEEGPPWCGFAIRYTQTFRGGGLLSVHELNTTLSTTSRVIIGHPTGGRALVSGCPNGPRGPTPCWWVMDLKPSAAVQRTKAPI